MSLRLGHLTSSTGPSLLLAASEAQPIAQGTSSVRTVEGRTQSTGSRGISRVYGARSRRVKKGRPGR